MPQQDYHLLLDVGEHATDERYAIEDDAGFFETENGDLYLKEQER